MALEEQRANVELQYGEELDRLRRLDEKFGKEGLTFDDVLLQPATAQPVASLMTSRDLITTPVGTTLEEASEILARHKIEKLPVVDAEGRLRGLITVKDIQKRIAYPHATKDEHGRLRVGAAVGVGPDAVERAEALVEADADVP